LESVVVVGVVKDENAKGKAARGHVKWFDPIKGFGFVLIESCDDAAMLNADALLHISVVRRTSLPSPGEGDELVMRIERGERGIQVVEIEEIVRVHRPVPDDIDAFERVIVRWFNRSKGYGFVAVVDDQGQENEDSEDVFLHVATLRRAGIELVDEGQYLKARIETGPKGAIATAVYMS
jgi:cold shock protein